ncbi:TIGR02466 family protein [Dyella caseinilytica]|uniref:2-oxoglutarate-Fe(II)-dependent oxygenase superfamily protein n=1 Tax=Dyella caseinilytica TaxID=1849581 RepID=A0ABX7GT19_9GAMM|nr:TIGR02466 family protein [Dyella caseinilytica]QRN53118.1 hypothetical protein ISN74_17015 [Dyella caseinilytica]
MNETYTVTMGEDAKASSSTLRPAQAFDLFPTRIWQVPLTHLAPRFVSWVEAIQALRAAAPVPAGRTNRGGWNSVDNAVLQQPVFVELLRDIRSYCTQAFMDMGMGTPAFDVQSWANIHDRGGFNFQHMHEGALLSGTFYLQVPEGSGALVFKDPRQGVLNSYAKGGGANAYKDIQLRPSAGLLVLFPHWLEHFVEPHGNDMPRICIPFNAMRP